jgi:hypothetical protein
MKSEIFEGLSEKTLLARPYQSSKAKGRGQNALFDGNTLNPRYKAISQNNLNIKANRSQVCVCLLTISQSFFLNENEVLGLSSYKLTRISEEVN